MIRMIKSNFNMKRNIRSKIRKGATTSCQIRSTEHGRKHSTVRKSRPSLVRTHTALLMLLRKSIASVVKSSGASIGSGFSRRQPSQRTVTPYVIQDLLSATINNNDFYCRGILDCFYWFRNKGWC